VHRFPQLAYWSTCVVLILAAATAGATTIVMPTDEQLVEKTPVIVSGTVVSTTPVDREGTIWTETRVAVSRTLKGTAGNTIVVTELGGVLGNRITKIFGSPEFAEGESVLLFLLPEGDRYRIVDLFAGKFGEGRTLDGQRLWLRPDSEVEANLLDREFPSPPSTAGSDSTRDRPWRGTTAARRPATRTAASARCRPRSRSG
jgi:hypothetical protein